MEKYSEYKDSGVQWLGEIPSHWKAVPFKSVFELMKGLSITKANLTDEGINVVSYGQIHSKQNKYTKIVPELYRKVSIDYLITNPQALCNKEDFLIADTSEDIVGSGNFVRVDKEQQLFAGYHTIIARNKNIDNGHFMSYFMQSDKWRMQIWVQVHGVKLYTITRGILNSTRLIIPPLAEQHSIVSYLDTKCSQLDTLLSNKEKEISLLQEMKQRVIADAVTRGINPSVKFKTTNIPWLQEIPEHWGKVKLKVLTLEGKNKNSENLETNVLSLSYGKIIRKKNINDGLVPSDYATYQIVDVDDIILRLTDLQNDHRSLRCGLVKERGIITSAYVCLKIRQGVSEYFYFLLHSFDIKKVFYSMGGGLRQSINYTEVSKLHVPVPPLSEQRSIVSYITERASKIDLLIEKLNKEIESIKEYKQRLISDVVTGQMKVC